MIPAQRREGGGVLRPPRGGSGNEGSGGRPDQRRNDRVQRAPGGTHALRPASQLARGYLGQADGTAARFVPRPFAAEIWADGVLHCEPGGSISQLVRRGRPFESYDAYYTPEVV